MTVVDTSERVFPRHRLANGLQIVAQPMEGVESASLGFLISAGARTERPTEAGISHFVEALGFQGTANRSVQELTEAFENIGAHPESGTETGFTSYSTTLLGRNLAPALELLTDVVLAVAGKLDFDPLVAQVEDLCADWPAGEGEPMPPGPPPQRHATIVRKDSAQQHIGLGLPAVPAGSDDFYAMALLAATLGGSMNSRLFLEVREKRSLAYGIGAYFTPLKDAGFMRIYAGTVPEKADQTVAVVLDELD